MKYESHGDESKMEVFRVMIPYCCLFTDVSKEPAVSIFRVEVNVGTFADQMFNVDT